MNLQKILALLLVCCTTASAQDPRAEWLSSVPKGLQKWPAFAYVEEDPALPRVLLIGDSISIGYTPTVRELLQGKANVLRIPANGGSTKDGMVKLDQWLGKGPWAVIHFNWGLHDLKRMLNNKLDSTGELVSSVDAYEKNLRQLVTKLKATGAKLIWASTTPVPEGSQGREARLEKQYNEAAERVMKEMGVQINDLWGGFWVAAEEAAVKTHPEQAKSTDLAVRNAWLSSSGLQRAQNVHFSDEGSRVLGLLTARAIERQLPAKK